MGSLRPYLLVGVGACADPAGTLSANAPVAARHAIEVPSSAYGIPRAGIDEAGLDAARKACAEGRAPEGLEGRARVELTAAGIQVDGAMVASLSNGRIFSDDVGAASIAPLADALREIRSRVDGFNDATGCRVSMSLWLASDPEVPGSTVRRTLLTARKERFLQADFEVADPEPDAVRTPDPNANRSMRVLVGSGAVDWFNRAAGPGVGQFSDLERVATTVPPREIVLSLSVGATWRDLVAAADASHAGRPHCVVFDPKGEQGLEVTIGRAPELPPDRASTIPESLTVLPIRLAPEGWKPGHGVVCGDRAEEEPDTGGIQFGSPVILGPISRVRLEAIVHSHRERFLACVPESARPLDVSVRIVAAKTGDVTSAVIKSASTTDDEVRDCIVAAMEDVAFPPADAAVIASVPLVFPSGTGNASPDP